MRMDRITETIHLMRTDPVFAAAVIATVDEADELKQRIDGLERERDEVREKALEEAATLAENRGWDFTPSPPRSAPSRSARRPPMPDRSLDERLVQAVRLGRGLPPKSTAWRETDALILKALAGVYRESMDTPDPGGPYGEIVDRLARAAKRGIVADLESAAAHAERKEAPMPDLNDRLVEAVRTELAEWMPHEQTEEPAARILKALAEVALTNRSTADLRYEEPMSAAAHAENSHE